jgi:hypothetical protein
MKQAIIDVGLKNGAQPKNRPEKKRCDFFEPYKAKTKPENSKNKLSEKKTPFETRSRSPNKNWNIIAKDINKIIWFLLLIILIAKRDIAPPSI